MHLHHPALSYNGKKRGKVKFRNAEEDAEDKKRRRAMSAPPLAGNYSLTIPEGRSTRHIPSLNNGVDNGNATMSPPKVYTGTKVKGIGTMHKSNAVPIFSDEEAIAISNMRR
jgi:hypothetical protein